MVCGSEEEGSAVPLKEGCDGSCSVLSEAVVGSKEGLASMMVEERWW